MTASQMFTLVNIIAILAWVLLAAVPRRWIASVVTGLAIPVLFAVIYVALIATNWRGSEGGFSSLSEVAILFSNPWLLLAGWTHYLAFDLFVGSWEVRDAQERGIPHLAVVPCLALTFLFGPAGWLLYLIERQFYGKR